LSPPRLPISPPRVGVDAYINLFKKLVNARLAHLVTFKTEWFF
jgi:hypothetical protein